MLSKALLFAAAISALLCVGTALLWARSYFYSDSLVYTGRTYSLRVQSDLGHGGIAVDTFPSNAPKFFMGSSRWSSGRVNRGYPYLTFRSLLGFRVLDVTYPLSAFGASGGGRGGNIHIRSIVLPMWIWIMLWALLPGGIYFRKRRKKMRWAFRKDIPWINHRLRTRIVRFALFSGAGIVLGAWVASMDIGFDLRGTKSEWMLAYAIFLPAACALIVFMRRRILWHHALLWMSLEMAGCLCFFEATVERIWNHCHVFLVDGIDLMQQVLMLEALCFVCGAILLFFLQIKPQKVRPGPYCPACGYCLIGSPRQVCPECGRAFTYDELGITPEALAVTADQDRL